MFFFQRIRTKKTISNRKKGKLIF